MAQRMCDCGTYTEKHYGAAVDGYSRAIELNPLQAVLLVQQGRSAHAPRELRRSAHRRHQGDRDQPQVHQGEGPGQGLVCRGA